MNVYKFRLLISENDEFLRDIEVRSDQTFLDFHKAIINCTELNDEELASFHICNRNWEKEKEITLIDMHKEEEDQERKIENIYVMNDAILEDFIKKPDQHLLYEYDFLNMKTFFIQLVGKVKAEGHAHYPRCAFSKGKINFDINSNEEPSPEDLKAELLKDFDELLNDQFEY